MPSRKRQSTMYVFPPSSLCNCRWLLNWTNLFRTRRRARKAQTAVAVTAMTTTSKIPPNPATLSSLHHHIAGGPCIYTIQFPRVVSLFLRLDKCAPSSLVFNYTSLFRVSLLLFFFYSGDSSVLARSFLKRLNLYKWPTLLLLILLVT